MKIQNLTRYDVQSLMGENADRYIAAAMRDVLMSQDKYSDTDDIPNHDWNDMICCAIERA